MSNYVALKPILPELTRQHLAHKDDGMTSLCGLRMTWEIVATITPGRGCQSCFRAYKARLEAFREKVKGEIEL
jgi:hypothetical protein